MPSKISKHWSVTLLPLIGYSTIALDNYRGTIALDGYNIVCLNLCRIFNNTVSKGFAKFTV